LALEEDTELDKFGGFKLRVPGSVPNVRAGFGGLEGLLGGVPTLELLPFTVIARGLPGLGVSGVELDSLLPKEAEEEEKGGRPGMFVVKGLDA